MKCSKCNNDVNNSDKFCGFCGKGNHSHFNGGQNLATPHVLTHCPRCNRRIKTNHNFCTGCYTSFDNANVDVRLEISRSEKNHDSAITKNKRLKQAEKIESCKVTAISYRSQGIQTRKELYKKIHSDYINSKEWNDNKIELLNIYKRKGWPVECIKCASNYNLHCHHNYYIAIDYLGDENISDIDYLCEKCHTEWHSIQKASGLPQNALLSLYYKFIFDELSTSNIKRIANVVSEKIEVDDQEIKTYFERKDVIKYEKVDAIAWYLIPISFVLLFAFGIGIVTAIIACIIFSKNRKPGDYDLYKERRSPIEIKKSFITTLINFT